MRRDPAAGAVISTVDEHGRSVSEESRLIHERHIILVKIVGLFCGGRLDPISSKVAALLLQTLVPRSVTFCVRRTGGWGRMIATDTPGTHIGSKQLFRCSWTDWVGQTVIRFVD